MTIRRILLLVFVAAIAVSCSRLPRSTKTSEETANLRQEYLQHHPDGKFNDQIMDGRVVKGMNTLEVLASWGLPNVRRAWTQKDEEYWTYYARDEVTDQTMSYELVFEDKVLTRWAIGSERGASVGTTLNRVPEGTFGETLRLGEVPGTMDSGGDTKGQKKK